MSRREGADAIAGCQPGWPGTGDRQFQLQPPAGGALSSAGLLGGARQASSDLPRKCVAATIAFVFGKDGATGAEVPLPLTCYQVEEALKLRADRCPKARIIGDVGMARQSRVLSNSYKSFHTICLGILLASRPRTGFAEEPTNLPFRLPVQIDANRDRRPRRTASLYYRSPSLTPCSARMSSTSRKLMVSRR